MHSIQAKTTLLTVCAIIVAMLVATIIGVVAIREIGNDNSEQMLHWLCETGEKNIDSYLESVQQSVELVSSVVNKDLANTDFDNLDAHVDRMDQVPSSFLKYPTIMH